MPAPMIRVTGLRKSYGANRVLDGVDLAVEAGTIFALLGPNGAGKTTTVRILSTLLKPDSGHAVIAGHDVVAAPQEVRRSISLTGQSSAVDELLTGAENLVMMGRLHHLGGAGARRRAGELLEQFDLVDARKRRVETYSGGMRRRLDLAVGLVTDPPVIFLDEPTTGLDPRSRRTMWDAITRLVANGTTILLTTQYLEEADQLADRVAVLDGGRVVAEGTAGELKRGLAGESVELFFTGEADLRAAVSALEAPADRIRPDDLSLRLPNTGGVGELKRILDRLEATGVNPTRLAVREPSLDDVFLALTGDARTAAAPLPSETTEPEARR